MKPRLVDMSSEHQTKEKIDSYMALLFERKPEFYKIAGGFLQCHLVLESAMAQVIVAALPQIRDVEKHYASTFAAKISLMSRLDALNFPDAVLQSLRKFNGIRNRIAHNLHQMEITDEEADALYSCVQKHFKVDPADKYAALGKVVLYTAHMTRFFLLLEAKFKEGERITFDNVSIETDKSSS